MALVNLNRNWLTGWPLPTSLAAWPAQHAGAGPGLFLPRRAALE